MEEIKSALTPELLITNGLHFHFKYDDRLDTTVILEEKDGIYHISNLNHIPINTLFQHPEHKILCDKLNLSWIYKDLPYPFLYITHEALQYILDHQIDDVLAFSHYLLKEYNLHPYIDSHSFLSKVIQNKKVDTFTRLTTSCQLIKVLEDKTLVNELEKHLCNVFEDKEKARYIKKFADIDIKTDVSKSTHCIKKEWYKTEVNYEGMPELPEQFFLLKSKKDIQPYTPYMHNKNVLTIDDILYKQSFYIGTRHRKDIIFEIEPLYTSNWFTFQIISLNHHRLDNNDITDLGYALAKPCNQEFFKSNYNKINPLNIKANYSINQLLDDIL